MQAIGTQLYTVNAMKRTEEKVFLAPVFDIKGVDTVLNANLFACKHTAPVDKGTGRTIAHSNADTCIPFTTPYRFRIVQVVFTANALNVGSPNTAFR